MNAYPQHSADSQRDPHRKRMQPSALLETESADGVWWLYFGRLPR